MQAQPELMRQHEAYKAVRERLFRRPKPAPVRVEKVAPPILVLRDCDEHVKAWRKWKRFSEAFAKSVAVKSFSTEGRFEIQLSRPPYDVSFSVGDYPQVPGLKRSIHDICLAVLRDFPGVTLDEVKGPRRSRNIVAARQACMFEVYTERKDVSFPMIGRFFGGRDHTTALHAVRKIEAQRAKESA